MNCYDNINLNLTEVKMEEIRELRETHVEKAKVPSKSEIVQWINDFGCVDKVKSIWMHFEALELYDEQEPIFLGEYYVLITNK